VSVPAQELLDGQEYIDIFVFISVYVYMLKLQNSRTVSGIDNVHM
jgi:hypothetical protein